MKLLSVMVLSLKVWLKVPMSQSALSLNDLSPDSCLTLDRMSFSSLESCLTSPLVISRSAFLLFRYSNVFCKLHLYLNIKKIVAITTALHLFATETIMHDSNLLMACSMNSIIFTMVPKSSKMGTLNSSQQDTVKYLI